VRVRDADAHAGSHVACHPSVTTRNIASQSILSFCFTAARSTVCGQIVGEMCPLAVTQSTKPRWCVSKSAEYKGRSELVSGHSTA
jgi:hypothetical protein